MRQIDERIIAYIALAAFCALSSARDVISELIFKNQDYNASPVFTLFVYSGITQLVAGTSILARHGLADISKSFRLEGDFLWLNLYTLLAFLFYFLAISSPIGAAVNSFVDYGTGPVFTALIGTLLSHERLDKTFALSAILSIVGIVVLNGPRIAIGDVSVLWYVGLTMSLLSSLSSGFYRVYFKRLLQREITKSSIIFFRLFGTTLLTGAILLANPGLFQMRLLPYVVLLGLLGFTAPLFLTLVIIQRVSIRRFAMLLFAIPVLTFALSATLGYVHVFISDVFAGAAVFLGLAIHERSRT
jgi:drug/metabolite transporter (DMT)-like permease